MKTIKVTIEVSESNGSVTFGCIQFSETNAAVMQEMSDLLTAKASATLVDQLRTEIIERQNIIKNYNASLKHSEERIKTLEERLDCKEDSRQYKISKLGVLNLVMLAIVQDEQQTSNIDISKLYDSWNALSKDAQQHVISNIVNLTALSQEEVTKQINDEMHQLYILLTT